METVTHEGPMPAEVVLLKSEPTYYVVLDVHPDVGWRLVRVVSARNLGRYRLRYPGPSLPIQEWEDANLPGPCSVVRDVKELRPDEADDFLDRVGELMPVDWRRVKESVR